jgi:hypothetical protein
MRKVLIAVLLLTSMGLAADKIKSVYKVTRLSPTVLGVSCPGNLGTPTVIQNVSGVLLITCGAFDPAAQ